MPGARTKWGIVKLSSIGDVAHALPVAAAIRRAYPEARIEWIVESPARDLVEHSPIVDAALVLDRGRSDGRGAFRRFADAVHFLGDVRSRGLDIVLDLQGLLKSGMIALFSGARERYGYDWLREGSRLMVKRIPARAESVHIVDKLLDVVRYLGLEPEPVEFPIGLLPAERDHVDDALEGAGLDDRRFVALNPAAAWASKEWPAARFADLADRIVRATEQRCVFLGGPCDGAKLDAVRAAAGCDHAYLGGAFNLREYAEVCRRASAYVGCDTGPTHVAAAAGARCIVPMGPTDPARNGPYGEGHLVIHKGHDCSPCKKKVCEDPVCVTEITTDEMFEAAASVILQR